MPFTSARRRRIASCKTSFDHLVGGDEQLVRNGETERLGGLVI